MPQAIREYITEPDTALPVGGDNRLIDPMVVLDSFATGVCLPERVGSSVRLTFFVDRRSPLDGSLERIVVSRVVLGRSEYELFVRHAAGSGVSQSRLS